MELGQCVLHEQRVLHEVKLSGEVHDIKYPFDKMMFCIYFPHDNIYQYLYYHCNMLSNHTAKPYWWHSVAIVTFNMSLCFLFKKDLQLTAETQCCLQSSTPSLWLNTSLIIWKNSGQFLPFRSLEIFASIFVLLWVIAKKQTFQRQFKKQNIPTERKWGVPGLRAKCS